MIVARAITKGRSLRASIRIPSKELDCLSPNGPPGVQDPRFIGVKHGPSPLAVTVVTARVYGVRLRGNPENSGTSCYALAAQLGHGRPKSCVDFAKDIS